MFLLGFKFVLAEIKLHFMNVLPAAQYGNFQCDTPFPYTEGTIARLTCQEGFQPEGNTQSVLLWDQGQWQWNPPSATCVPVLNTLPETLNGQVTCDQPPPYREGMVAHLHCRDGYEVYPKNQSTLVLDKGNLRWDPPFFTCYGFSVLNLPDAHEGKFISDHSPPYREGTVAHMVCNEGYGSTLAIQSVVVLDHGRLKWTLPFAYSCEPAVHTLPQAKHGQFIADGLPPYVEGITAQLVCDEGYGTKSKIVSIVTRENGKTQWKPPSAECVDIDVILPHDFHGWYTSEASSPYVAGDKATLKCDDGYVLEKGSETIATWHPWGLDWEPELKCLPYLTNLPVAEKGRFTSDKKNYYVAWDKAKLTCDPGYTSNVTESVVVQDEVKWDSDVASNWEPDDWAKWKPAYVMKWDPAYVKCIPRSSQSHSLVWLLFALALVLILLSIRLKISI